MAKGVFSAVKAVKEGEGKPSPEAIFVLADGTRVRVVPVTSSLIDDVTQRIKDPPVPTWHNEDKGRDEPNPSDPNYLAALDEAARRRGIAASDALVMFGVDLVDGLPQDSGWLSKLRYMEKRGLIDLGEYNSDDPLDREFMYKRYVVANASIIREIGRASGITGEEIRAAEESFPGS